MSGSRALLSSFPYDYKKGPVSKSELTDKLTSGNCRLALQHYFHAIHGKYLTPKQILLPYAYHHIGAFIKPSKKDFFLDLIEGDIIYAERIRNKDGKEINRSRSKFDSKDEWIYHFHSAIYIGSNKIWHATAIEGGTCVWITKKFLQYYKPVAAKRLI